ncbi:Type II secretion system protein E [Rubripirellula lacrimiformis]|uniref:Type II secretion system protein E n=2 Tax=Rubripirellula lacrimiformis TaxID=1930273 RepID=A0A517NA80_9BACT|nr:Type II secretion system protein E [Rubripirellula lacrimiformis]
MPTDSLSPFSVDHLDPRSPNYAIDVVDKLIVAAVASDASDVHIQPRAEGWDVMFRIDGVLSAAEPIRSGGDSDPVKRLMVMAGLPTYRSGQPMEGRLRLESTAPDDRASIRLGIYPTIHGPRATIRLLRKSNAYDRLPSLGLADDVAANLTDLCRQTDGAILLSGPAGSGKTTTLYAMLRLIASSAPRRSVVTIEDPVESIIADISQSELDPSAGMTLAKALRSAVRQDSEVLLVSEIRDPETAEAALQTSLTGHLVFSSLHATDVAASLRRLVQFGIPAYIVRSGIRAIVTQRLLRRRCSDCAPPNDTPTALTPPDDTAATATSLNAPSKVDAAVCENCLGTGYRGQIAIANCVRFDGNDPVGDALADALTAGSSTRVMRDAAHQAGLIDLHQRANQCVQAGLTDPAEVYRVLGSPAVVR